jgi:hypothetical protein
VAVKAHGNPTETAIIFPFKDSRGMGGFAKRRHELIDNPRVVD